jgi:hypothetical protein
MKHLAVKSNGKYGNKNALKHGTFSRQFVLPNEDLTAFRQLQVEIERDLAPEGPLQRELAQTIVVWMWRRRRIVNAPKIRDLVTPDGPAGATAFNPGDPRAVEAGERLQRCATKLALLMTRWAMSATARASSHAELDRVVAMLGDGFGIDTARHGQDRARDLDLRKKQFTAVIKNLSSETKAFGDQALALVGAAARDSFALGLKAEIELAARVDAELERAIKRYYQLRLMQSTVNSMAAPPAGRSVPAISGPEVK